MEWHVVWRGENEKERAGRGGTGMGKTKNTEEETGKNERGVVCGEL